MKIIKIIIVWYLIGITFASIFIGAIILTYLLKCNNHIAPDAMKRLAPIVMVLGGLFGIVGYSGFSSDSSQDDKKAEVEWDRQRKAMAKKKDENLNDS